MSVLSVEERSVGERVLTGATFFLVVQRKTGKQTKGSRDFFVCCVLRLCAAFVCCAFVCCVCVLCVCVLRLCAVRLCAVRLCAVRLCAACSEILMDE